MQNYFLSFCVELSCKSCLAKLFLNLLHGAVVQKLPFETIPQAPAWHHRARVVFRSYFLCFCMQLSCKRFLAKLFLQLLSYGAVTQGCQAKVLGAVWAMLGAVESVSSRCCVQLSRTSCLAALFLALLHGAVMPKLPCRTIP